MNIGELNRLKQELKISVDKIIREEAEMIFLYHLANSAIGTKVAFYGGTALRLVYDSPRFSEDIDLIKIQGLSFSEFKKFIHQTVKDNQWKLKDIKDKRQTFFALISITDKNLKHPFSIKIEIHKKKLEIETELSLIKSPTSALSPLLLVPQLLSLKKLKEEAIMDRKKARDIFDLWYIDKVLRIHFILPEKLPTFKEKEFKNELQVFLPFTYYPIVNQLYEQINKTN